MRRSLASGAVGLILSPSKDEAVLTAARSKRLVGPTVRIRKIFTHNLKALASGIVGNAKNLHPAFSPGRST